MLALCYSSTLVSLHFWFFQLASSYPTSPSCIFCLGKLCNRISHWTFSTQQQISLHCKTFEITTNPPSSLPTAFYMFKNFLQHYTLCFKQQCVCSKCFASLDKREVCAICANANSPVHSLEEMPGLLVHTLFEKPLITVLSSKPFTHTHTPSPYLSVFDTV